MVLHRASSIVSRPLCGVRSFEPNLHFLCCKVIVTRWPQSPPSTRCLLYGGSEDAAL